MPRNSIVRGVSPVSSLVYPFPNAHYSLHQGVSVGSAADTVPDETGTLPPLLVAVAGTDQWTGNAAFWTGNGSSFRLASLFSGDLSAFRSVCEFGTGCGMVGMEVLIASSATAGRRLIVCGEQSAALYGWQVRASGTGDVAMYAGNSSGVSSSGRTAGVNLTTINSGHVLLFFVWDLADTQTMTPYVYTPGTATLGNTPTPLDISSEVDSIVLGPADINANAALHVGGQINNAGTAAQWFDRSIRRVRIFNFGQNKPSNLADIMAAFAQHRLLDNQKAWRLMQDAAA